MDQKLRVFRIDEECFLITLIESNKITILRLGQSVLLSPALQKSIDIVILSSILPIDYATELKALKLHKYNIDYIALRNIFLDFQTKIQHLEKANFPLQRVSVKTGNLIKSLPEKTGKFRIFFIRGGNIELKLNNQVLFNLNFELDKPFDQVKAQKDLKEFIKLSYLSTETSALDEYSFNLEQLMSPASQKSAKKLEDSFEVNNQQLKLGNIDLIAKQGEQSLTQDKILFLKFGKELWLECEGFLETSQSLEIGKEINFTLITNDRELLSLKALLIEGTDVYSENYYAYRFLLELDSRNIVDKIKQINSFRLKSTILKMVNELDG